VTNGPWRDGKGHPYEGGHRVPFIARWPGKIPAGTTSDYTLVMTDLFATAADVVGKKLPDEAAVDSVSVLPTLLQSEASQTKRQFVFIQGDDKDSAIIVRSGDWKLIVRYDADRKTSYELYHLVDDPGELTDVSQHHGVVVRKLASALEQAEAAGRTRLRYFV
jgi:arylsulfatase A